VRLWFALYGSQSWTTQSSTRKDEKTATFLIKHLIRGLKTYIEAKTYLFNGPPSIAGSDFDSRYSQRGVQWAVKQGGWDYHGGLCAYAGTLLLRIYSKTDSILSRLKNLGTWKYRDDDGYLHIAQLDTIKPLVHLIPCLPSGGSSYVLDKLGQNIENLGLNTWQLRTLSAVRRCRTAALGDILIVVIHVGISALAITPVAIDTVPNVRVKPRRLDTS
jgi:hypothetical protein